MRTRNRIFLLVLITVGCSAEAPSPAAHSALAGLETVPLPAYNDEYFIQFAATEAEYLAARADDRYKMEQFTYPSDELTVGAYLYRPVVKPSEAAPVIVFVRGSVVRDKPFAGEILTMAHRYAEAGYIVVAPHLRGSLGWAGVDELGGAELHDLINLVPQLGRIEGADPRKVFLAGESRGGAEVYMALRDGFPAHAAAVWGAFTDLEDLLRPDSPQAKFASAIWPDLEKRRAELVRTRSAIAWADQIDVPVLIMHGGADDAIPPWHSEKLHAKMTGLGKCNDLIVFAGEGHVIGGRAVERDAAALAWFARFAAP